MRALTILGPGNHHQELEQLRAAGFETVIAADSLLSPSADLVVILGGDGTIHRFLPQIVEARLPLLVIPCGSGNDLARALGIGSVPVSMELARSIVRGEARVHDVDLGRIIDDAGAHTPFCCVCGIGLDAVAAEFANHLPRWMRGRGGYLLGAARAVVAAPSITIKVSAPEREISGTLCLFSVANTPSFGGGLRIAPDASVTDGLFDCVSVQSMTRRQLVPRVFSLLRATHLKLKEVSHFRTERLRIETDIPVSVYADGEPVGKTPVQVGVARRALRVFAGL